MNTNTVFAAASSNNADRMASYNSDFQHRLDAMNAASLRARQEEQERKAAQVRELDAAVDLIFA